MNKYLATIITPFHNTDLRLFKSAFESVRSQTIGIDSIEWIIVVHNSEPGYLESVKEMTKDYDTIRVYELNNNCHTASSPRNFAFENAHGKYLFFLDSDDHMTLDCIEKVTEKMEQTGAQICKFRAEKEFEDEKVLDTFDPRVRFDQTKEVIEYLRGDPNIKDLLTVTTLTPWTQALRRDLVEDNHIRYNLETTVGEDFEFNVICICCADKIIALPQLIGYVYYINHASTLQSGKPVSPESLMKFMKDLFKGIDLGINFGLDMRYLFWSFAGVIGNDLMHAPQITDEQRAEFRDTFGKYFDLVEPLESDEKFFPGTKAQEYMEFCRINILGDAEERTARAERDTLLRILQDNKATDYGRSYGFSTIHTYQAFADKVPVTDYQTYEPMISLIDRLDEKNLLFMEDLQGFVMTSGKQDKPKLIPYNASHIRPYIDALVSEFKTVDSSTFLIMSSTLDEKSEIGRDTITGAALRRLDKSLLYSSHARSHKYGSITSPRDVVFPEEHFDSKNLCLVFALADPDVEQIIAPFTWNVLEYFEYLENNHREIVDQIRTGNILVNNMSKELLDRQTSQFRANPERANELEVIFAEGFDKPVIKRIWPGFRKIVAVGTPPFQIYTEDLKRYAGDDIIFDNGYYAASEAVVGCSLGPGTDEYILLTDHDFFEFLPAGQTPSKEALLQAKDVKPGTDYEVFVTNTAGLYRYRLGDIIHVVRMKDTVPVFTYVRRYYDVCSAGNVTLSLNDFERVIPAIEKEAGIDVREYCIETDQETNGFHLMIELSPVETRRPDAGDLNMQMLSQAAERLFCKQFENYAEARNLGEIAPIHVSLLEPETQLLYRDKYAASQKCSEGQLKPVRILDTMEKSKFFHAFIMK